MKNIAILTDFINFDPAYSLCRVVRDQIKALALKGYKPRLLVRDGFDTTHSEFYPGAEVITVQYGQTGSNKVKVTDQSEQEIETLQTDLASVLAECEVVFTHDLIYQANMWKAHVAARRLVAQLPTLRWFHWVHSASPTNVVQQTGRYKDELKGKFPNSTLVAMHAEEFNRKGEAFGYENDEIVIVPNPVDFLDGMNDITLAMVDRADLMSRDVILVYPCRLDRGKQPHIVCEIGAELRVNGCNAVVIICDFHSTAGDKTAYRQELKRNYGDFTFFTSDIEGCEYLAPHQAVMELLEVGDILVHPSRSESDPLIVPEACWKRAGLVLNFDLPVFRKYDGVAVFGKFSSNIDALTGGFGETNTSYGNRRTYMSQMAGAVAYQVRHNPILKLHATMRQTRSIEAISGTLWEIIEGC